MSEGDILVLTDTTISGVLSGKADLSGGKVVDSQLPSYVDDVLSYPTFSGSGLSGFPASGEDGKLYVAKDTNKLYRYTGSGYVVVGGDEPPVTSVNGQSGAVTLSASDLGAASSGSVVLSAVSGYGPWICDPAAYCGYDISIVQDSSGWKPVSSSGDLSGMTIGSGGSTELVWTSGNTSYITITATRSASTDLILGSQSGSLIAGASGVTSHIADTTRHVTATDRALWGGKQDAVSDLSTIRTNASCGLSAYVSKADKVSGATSGNFAALDSSGNLKDAGYSSSSFVQKSSLPAGGILATTASGALQAYSAPSGLLSGNGEGKIVAMTVPSGVLVGKSGQIDVGTANADYLAPVSGATSGNFAALTSSGAVVDSAYSPSDFSMSGHTHSSIVSEGTSILVSGSSGFIGTTTYTYLSTVVFPSGFTMSYTDGNGTTSYEAGSGETIAFNGPVEDESSNKYWVPESAMPESGYFDPGSYSGWLVFSGGDTPGYQLLVYNYTLQFPVRQIGTTYVTLVTDSGVVGTMTWPETAPSGPYMTATPVPNVAYREIATVNQIPFSAVTSVASGSGVSVSRSGAAVTVSLDSGTRASLALADTAIQGIRASGADSVLTVSGGIVTLPECAVTSVAGKSGAVTLTASDVGALSGVTTNLEMVDPGSSASLTVGTQSGSSVASLSMLFPKPGGMQVEDITVQAVSGSQVIYPKTGYMSFVYTTGTGITVSNDASASPGNGLSVIYIVNGSSEPVSVDGSGADISGISGNGSAYIMGLCRSGSFYPIAGGSC